MRKMFGPKRDEVTDLRRLHNEELYDFLTKYYSGDQIKKNEVGGQVTRTREARGAYRALVVKHEGKETTWKT